MTTESLYTQLYREFSRLDGLHPHGIAVSEPPVFGRREGTSRIYEEGLTFSGIESNNTAETWITPITAAHISSLVSADKYISEACNVFGGGTSMPPRYKGLEALAPQVILWWKGKDDTNAYDFIEMNKLNMQKKQDICRVVKRKLVQGIDFIDRIKGKPTIWGTWGYGTKEEREKEGLTRGGPTMKEGHIHISFLEPEEQKVKLQELPLKNKLNHYSPLNNIILEKFGDDISKVIFNELYSLFKENKPPAVSRENKIEFHKNNTVSVMNGIEIKFGEVQFDDVFELLTRISDKFENIYQNLHLFYHDYHCHTDERNRDEIKNRTMDYLKEQGFSSNLSLESVGLIFSIQPTLGQLLVWQNEISENKERTHDLYEIEKKINKYKEVVKKLKDYKGNMKFLSSIIEDQVKYPSDESITQTMPVHASFCYIIDDYDVKDKQLFVHSLHLYPEFLTTESAPERKLGLVLRRSINNIE
jgi:hypothetical protein